jgi:hypothetical protein
LITYKQAEFSVAEQENISWPFFKPKTKLETKRIEYKEIAANRRKKIGRLYSMY